MNSSKPRLCIFGDSHLGAVRNAVREGHEVSELYDITFWGAAGPVFRKIDFIGGRFRCRDAETEAQVRLVSGLDNTELDPARFDLFLFWGARFRPSEFAVPYLHFRMHPELAVSNSVAETAAQRFVRGRRSIQAGAEIASAGTPVFYVPAPLPAWDLTHLSSPRSPLAEYPAARLAGPVDRAWVLGFLYRQLTERGIVPVPQPDDTITEGIFTSASYSVESPDAEKDFTHMNADFGARMLSEFLTAVKGMAKVRLTVD